MAYHDDEHDEDHENDTDDEEEEDEEDDEEEEDDDEERNEERAAASSPRPRARIARAAGAVSTFGAVPQKTTHFRVRRKSPAGVWETLSHATPGAITAHQEWPVPELSEKLLQERWGPGVYRVTWLEQTNRGGLRRIADGRIVEIRPSAAAAPLTPAVGAPLTPGLPQGMQDAFALIAMMDQRTTQQVSLLRELAQGQQHGGGIDASTLAMLLQTQQQNTQLMLSQMQQQSAAQLATMQQQHTESLARLERRIVDLDAGEEEPEATGPRPVKLPRDAGWLDMAKAYAMANPDKLLEIVSGVPGFVAGIAAEVAKRSAAREQAVQQGAGVTVRPRAQIAPAPTPQQPQPSAEPGLNTHVTTTTPSSAAAPTS